MTYKIHIIYKTNIVYITHITCITHIAYITHMIKLIFKAHKKTDKIFFKFVFLYIKMTKNYYKKKETFQEAAHERYQKLSKEEKDKK